MWSQFAEVLKVTEAASATSTARPATHSVSHAPGQHVGVRAENGSSGARQASLPGGHTGFIRNGGQVTLLDRLEREWLASPERKREQRDAEKLQRTKVGDDSSRPWHPLFNINSQEVLEGWVREREWQERKPFQPEWDEVVSGLRCGLYRSRHALAVSLCRSKNWAAKLLSVVVKQGVMSRVEVRASFKGKSLGTPLTATRKFYGGRKPMTRDMFERVFQKTHGVGLDMVVRLLRLGAWKSPVELAHDCQQTVEWASSLRTMLMRERVFASGQEWADCFQPTNWSLMKRKYERARDGASAANAGTGHGT